MYQFLLKQFLKQTGRKPNNLENILLKQKASKQAIDERKIVSMSDRSSVNPNKPILGGKNIEETEEQIRQRLIDQNKKGIESLRNKNKPDDMATGGRAGYAVGNQVMPAIDPGMNLDYNTLVNQNTAKRDTQTQNRGIFSNIGQALNPSGNTVLQRMQENQANQTSFGDKIQNTVQAGINNVSGLPQHLQDTEKLAQLGLTPENYNIISAMNASDNMNAGVGSLIAPASIYTLGDTVSNSNQDFKEGVGDLGRYMKGVNIQNNPELAKQLMGEDYVNDMLNKYDLSMEKIGKPGYKPGPDPSKYSTTATAAEPSAMPQGSPGQLNPTPTSNEIPGAINSLINVNKPTMADVAGPASGPAGYTKLRKFYNPFSDEGSTPMTKEEYENKSGYAPPFSPYVGYSPSEFYPSYYLDAVGPKSQEGYDSMLADLKNYTLDFGNNPYNTDLDTYSMYQNALDDEGNPVGKFTNEEARKEYDEKKAFRQSRYNLGKSQLDNYFNNLATGGRAGYYGGGQAVVGEDLSEIGHGSDSLMARNMQIAPGGQATTSTGLNYLLGQDNDTVRIPYAGGGMSKRAFLKLLGAFGAGAAGLKSGILGLGKGAGKEVVKEVAKEAATGGAPPHFLKLVAKIKALGDDVTETAATSERQNVKQYKDFEMTEDVSTGEIQIFKNSQSDEALDRFASENANEEVFMRYKPGKGQADETTKGKAIADEYEENTSYISNNRENTGEILEEISGVPDDIFKEVGEAVPEAIRKGKADGGRIGYAGGKKVVEGLASLIKKKFGDNAITTADKLKTPQKTLDRDMFSKFKDRNPDPKREITDDEFQDLMEDVGDLDAYNFDGTIGSANKIRKEAKDYQDYMYKQYKMGKLDPVAGDKSPARKRFLQQKFDEMEASGDSKLMTREEIEELSTFDLGTQMDEAAKKTLPKIDDKLLKNYNKEIKEGVAKIMSDTSPEGLAKSIEIDNLMLKYPGMDKNLADQIASSSPTMKADMIAMVEQTFKMDEMGMSGDDIIQTFKNTTRTKQASGGLAAMLGE